MKKILTHALACLAVFSMLVVGHAGRQIAFANDNSNAFGGSNGSGSLTSGGANGAGNTSSGGANGAGNTSFGGSNGTGRSSSNLRFTNPIKANSLSELLVQLLRVVTMLGAIVVVFFIIWSGFKYVTARGDSKKISEATKTLTWTVVGAAIILGAQVIARAIQGTITQLGS